jgi:hypothetical protein
MLPYYRDFYGNPSSMHTFGGRIHHNIENARAQVAALIGADPQEIIFELRYRRRQHGSYGAANRFPKNGMLLLLGLSTLRS